MNPLTQAREALQANHDWHMRDDPIAYIGSEMERVNMAALAAPVETEAPSAAQSALDQIELMLGGCTAIEVVRAALSAQQAAQPVAQEPVAWRQLTYATPMDLWRAFRAGTKFRLHYHGQKVYDITRMEPRDRVIYVSPPRFPVKVFPNGQSAEGDNGAIWLEELTAAPSPVVLVPMTDEQVSDLYARWYGTPGTSYADLIRAVEAHHGIKAGKDGAP